jgi:peptidoglycan-associated lipoprotein
MKMTCRRFALIVTLSAAIAGCGSTISQDDKPTSPTIATVAPGSAQDFFVNVGDRVFFNENSADLTSTAIETLDKQAAWLLKYAAPTVTIEGHADEKGDRARNMAIGNRRALAVRNYLLSKGILAERIKTVSYGRERRVATCNEISCWSQNRRAVTVLDGADPMPPPSPAPMPAPMTPTPQRPR